MTAQPPAAWLRDPDNGLARLWAGQRAFQILDLSFGNGESWRRALAAWRADPTRPRMLHYVALQAPLNEISYSESKPDQSGGPEVTREEFDNGAVLQTLFSGSVTECLRALRMDADLILLTESGLEVVGKGIPDAPLHEPDRTWFDPWTAKLLARCCHRGTQLWATELPATAAQALADQGFETLNSSANSLGDARWLGHYNPCWQPKTRIVALPISSDTQNAIVVGAGLAGASTAYALARRGWAVQVLDTALDPAQGASSLPVGLMAAHTSADDNPRSRLTRAGVHMTRSQASRLLVRGEGWDESGLLSLKPGAAARFQARGTWIKPQALVNAWLDQPGISFLGGAQVGEVQWDETGHWRVLASDGAVMGRAPLVVLAAAGGCVEILRRTMMPAGSSTHEPAGQTPLVPRLALVPGQVSWGPVQQADCDWLPTFSINGQGYLAANVPMEGGRVWLTGATFEEEASQLTVEQGHAENFARLQQLLPGAAAALKQRFDSAGVQSWRQVRCTTPDRLPICGPVGKCAPGLWLNTGYGARGLTWSVLCAELLAARLHNEPVPLAAPLTAKLDYRV